MTKKMPIISNVGQLNQQTNYWGVCVCVCMTEYVCVRV